MRSLVLALLLLAPAPPEARDRQSDRQFFEQRIRPILRDSCIKCHGEKATRNNLDLTSRAGLLRGGDHGPAVVPGRPERSLLIRAVHYQGDFQMPPKQKLDSKQIADLVEWVKRGAPWPTP